VEETGGHWRPRHPLEAPLAGSRSVRFCPGSNEPLQEGEVPVARVPTKSFPCGIVSETVTITLRRRKLMGGDGKLFVQCSEVDCQYVDANEPPCPLTLDLFAAEVEERNARQEGSPR